MFKNVPALQIFNQFCAYISVNTILYLICGGTFSEVGTVKHKGAQWADFDHFSN